MNCREGDLAVVVRSDYEQNVGVLVSVIAAHPGLADYWYVVVLGRAEVYREGRLHPAGSGGVRVRAADSDLRPLRNGEGEDETFTWAGKPQGITQ